MRFRVELDALTDALGWVARALPSRPVVPVLAGLRLQAAGDGLTLSCFDYEVAATIRIAAEVAEAGAVLVPGRLLAEITRSLAGTSAEFDTAGDVVNLTCGSAEFTLVPLPLAEYPDPPEPGPLAGIADGGELATAIAQVLPAASRDDTLPMLTGVCLDIDGAAMTLAATDRYRLAVRDLTWQPVSPGLRAIALVPGRTLADAARMMAPGTAVRVSFKTGDDPERDSGARDHGGPGRSGAGEPRPAEGMITFEGAERRLTTRLIGGEFIRYASRFPEEFGCQAEVAAAPFIEAVRRVSLVAERTTPVRLRFGPGTVVIEAHTDGRARAVETLPADFTGDEPVIAFNPQYLLDGLTAAASGPAAAGPAASGPAGAGQETAGQAKAGQGKAGEAEAGQDAGPPADRGLLRLDFTSPAKPALITWADRGAAGAGRPAFRYLVVPLRAPARG